MTASIQKRDVWNLESSWAVHLFLHRELMFIYLFHDFCSKVCIVWRWQRGESSWSYPSNSTYERGCADKSLARPGRKKTYSDQTQDLFNITPWSSIQFLARCSNFCKSLKKKKYIYIYSEGFGIWIYPSFQRHYPFRPTTPGSRSDWGLISTPT